MYLPVLRTVRLSLIAVLLSTLLVSCRGDELVMPSEYLEIPEAIISSDIWAGMYILNEGNMGSNKCTLDYLDFATGTYRRNFYGEVNPEVVMELGDVGNACGVYGSKLYVVVNCSHKVEVLDSRTGRRLGQVDIPNCRSLAFHGDKAYVSSYVSTIIGDVDAPRGMVCEIDTASLSVTRRVEVGYQPEEMAVVGRWLYVANSGGYRPPEYDNTVSRICLDRFELVDNTVVDINLHRLRADSEGNLWVSSRGDGKSRHSRLFFLEIDHLTGAITSIDRFATACSNMAIHDDLLYYISYEWSDENGDSHPGYGVINTKTRELVSENFISDGTELSISHPYGLAVNPVNGDVIITDAKNYVSSGTLYCFSPSGFLKWKATTGDIPASIAFAPR